MASPAQPIFGYSGGVDRYGIQTHHVGYTAMDLSEVASVALGQTVNGIPELSREASIDPCGTITVTVQYEGVEDPSKFAPKYQYALRASFKEEPLEANPNILQIANQYGGTLVNERYTFPLYLPSKGSSAGSRGNNQQQQKNPFFGVDKYMVLMLNWQRTYAASYIPVWLLASVGSIIGGPPGSPPSLPNRNQWVVMPPTAQQRGNIYLITEEYLLLEENSPPLIYSQGKNPSGSDAGSGSTLDTASASLGSALNNFNALTENIGQLGGGVPTTL